MPTTGKIPQTIPIFTNKLNEKEPKVANPKSNSQWLDTLKINLHKLMAVIIAKPKKSIDPIKPNSSA